MYRCTIHAEVKINKSICDILTNMIMLSPKYGGHKTSLDNTDCWFIGGQIIEVMLIFTDAPSTQKWRT